MIHSGKGPDVGHAERVRKGKGAMGMTRLEHAPDAWMYQLVRSLRRKDRLALFRTCKALAKHVLTQSPRLMLRVCRGKYNSPSALEAARCFITHLLDVNRDFEIVQQDKQLCPFPTKLSRLVKFTLFLRQDSNPLQDCFDWAALENLQELSWHYSADERDVNGLCDALEAGHLKKLTRFTFDPHYTLSSNLLTRLASLIGPQTSHLCGDSDLQAYLQYFTALQSMETYEPVSKALWEHPTVRTVVLKATRDSVTYGDDFSQGRCNWETLVVEKVAASRLLKLPLSGLKEIQFHGRFPYNTPPIWLPESEQRAGQQFISQHRSKIVCKPIAESSEHFRDLGPMYRVHELCDEEFFAVSTIKEACQVYLQPQVVEDLFEYNHMVSELWGALPPCVHTIMVTVTRDFAAAKWSRLWQGLPSTVTTIAIDDKPYIMSRSIEQLAHSLPGHIKRLKVPRSCVREASFIWKTPAHICLTFGAE